MTWELTVENIAGIRSANEAIVPGVNAVRASNWQGKSSFLQGVQAVFGTETPLTEGADQGRVELNADGEAFEVRLERDGVAVSRRGTPYLSSEYDRICADLFAFLDENNAVRKAVRDGEPLEPLLTRPLDFEDIDSQLAELRSERDQVERELERANDAAERLPKLQERETNLEAELEELRSEREALDADGDDTEARAELSDLRAERERVQRRVDRLEQTVERVESRLAENRTELSELTVPEESDIETELEQVRERLRSLERDRELLQGVFEANKRVLDSDRTELLTDVSRDVLGDTAECWLCGTETTSDEMADKLDALDEQITELRREESEYRTRVEELDARRDEVKTARRQEADLTDRIAELETSLDEKNEELSSARDRLVDLEARVDEVTESVETESERLTDIESEIKYTEAELENVRAELADAESRAEQREMLSAEYDDLTAEIASLRNRKDEIKQDLRESFSTALAELFERFDTGFEMARLTSTFDLVVARDGRETTLDALSEGERELLGFVVALAGHEAYDVGERVPVLLLDGLGSLASDNIATFVEYTADRVDYLVLTAYPEHGGFDANELSPSDWDVVSHRADTKA
ncbi:archaea-specific SMC-related protein [Haloarcula argentinensis]|uniref:ATPase n=1 Tax=Haloarcula argentinensis TaxID=43776 RepID=A0ABU2F4V5_HALAR|nr:archaea-specific SMC-related protein [Haloarcula argentinensis]EMA17958.1 chromosome segregation ATPase-like protein [Haloarcula argentinensis DSM 12282]MDS0255589.1 ATPase [Haloarcula argentinensis]